jgi:hypothetical protein
MSPFQPRFPWRVGVAGVGLLAWLSLTPFAWSQHGPDPFNGVGEYNAGLEPYLYATYPNSLGFFPGQGALAGRAGARQSNSFQSYLDSLEASETSGELGSAPLLKRSGAGVPYYSAYRQYDKNFGRTSTVSKAEQDFARDQESMNDKYFQYLNERDPKKRAQLYREYQQERSRVSRDLSIPRPGRGIASATSGAAPGFSSSRTRRMQAAPGSPSPSAAPGLGRGMSPVRPSPSATRTPGASRFPTPSATESPSEVLERSEVMDRANRPGGRSAPPAVSPRRTPAPFLEEAP